MKIKSFLSITIIILSVMAIQCSRTQSPFSPEALSNKALLNGKVVLSDSSTASFEEIQVGIKGTSLYTTPDGYGNFQIDDLPLGNIVVEFYVQSDVSDIQINNVKSGEEIIVTVEIQSDNQAVLADMERNNDSTSPLKVEIRPMNWNVNWENSEDEVIAKISGDEYDQIVSGTVKMESPDGLDPIDSYEEDVGGVYFIAKFYQKDAITLIADPETGESYEIHVTGELEDGSTFDLSDTITIVGKKKDMGELRLDIRPDHWNVNWTESDEEVNAMISGEGYDTIDYSTVEMVGPYDTISPISPYTYEVGGVYFIAKFYQNLAITLITDPESGEISEESYEIHVTGVLGDGTIFDLKDTITIVGKSD